MTMRQGGVVVLGGEGGFSVDSAQLPTCERLRFSSYFFFLEDRFPFFSMEGKIKRIICSNNHFSVTAGKGAFPPIFVCLPKDRHRWSIDEPSVN